MTICDFAPPHYAASDYRRANPLPHRCGAMCRAVERFSEAVEDGFKWGNMMYALEQQTLAKLTASQKAALDAKKAAEDEVFKKKVVSQILEKKKVYISADGLAKRKYNRMCKKERYDGGCFQHNEKHGSCSFVHKDERSRYEAMFAGFGMKMVEDASYFAELAKMDKASGYMKYQLEKTCDAMENTLKGQARCVFITGVDVAGNLTFSKANPAHDESKSSGNSSSSGAKKQQQQQQQSNVWEKKVDNGAW
jgi:hypothetical protein